MDATGRNGRARGRLRAEVEADQIMLTADVGYVLSG